MSNEHNNAAEADAATSKLQKEVWAQLYERQGVLSIGRALYEFGRRITYRVDIEAAFADLSENDQERVRDTLTKLRNGGGADA